MHEEGGSRGTGKGGVLALHRAGAEPLFPHLRSASRPRLDCPRKAHAGDGVGYAGKRRRSRVTAKKWCSWRTRSKKARSDISRPSLVSLSSSGGTGFWNPIALRSDPVPRGVGHEREEALDSPDSVARLRHPAPGRGRLGGLGESVVEDGGADDAATDNNERYEVAWSCRDWRIFFSVEMEAMNEADMRRGKTRRDGMLPWSVCSGLACRGRRFWSL